MPDGNGDKGGAFLAHDGAIEALESMDDEQKHMCPKDPRNRAIESHREGTVEEVREVGGAVAEDVCRKLSVGGLNIDSGAYPMSPAALSFSH